MPPRLTRSKAKKRQLTLEEKTNYVTSILGKQTLKLQTARRLEVLKKDPRVKERSLWNWLANYKDHETIGKVISYTHFHADDKQALLKWAQSKPNHIQNKRILTFQTDRLTRKAISSC